MPEAKSTSTRKLAAILLADVVSYSRMMGEDEEGTLARLKTLLAELIEPTILAFNGRIVKLLGDGILAEFPSSVEATACAVTIQESMPRRNADIPENRQIRLGWSRLRQSGASVYPRRFMTRFETNSNWMLNRSASSKSRILPTRSGSSA
jgi:hypothetical protein